MYNLTLKPRLPINAKQGADGLVLSIPAAGGYVDLENLPSLSGFRYLVLDTTQNTEMTVRIRVDFYTRDSAEPAMTMNTSSLPGVRVAMPMDFEWFDNRNIFRPRVPGSTKIMVQGTAIAPEDVVAVKLYFREFYTDAEIVFHGVYLTEEEPEKTLLTSKILLDELGQVATRDWPGKTKSYGEMEERIKSIYEKALESKSKGMDFPTRFGYSRWGGDAGKKLTEGSGYFAVKKDGDIWYLVDPDGYAFFSVGPDCTGAANSAGVIAGIESLHAWLPDREKYEEAYGKPRSSFGSKPLQMLNFYKVNMMRVFGEDWFDAFCLITEYQMREMGFNTIANWSDPKVIAKTGLPYVTPLRGFPTTDEVIYRDFPDVFSGEYEKNSAKFAEQMEEYRGDARLIGYFMRNEPQWGFSQDINLALEMFRSGVPYESKRVFWQYLMEKYGDAAALSKAWGIEVGCEDCFMALGMKDLPERGACADDLKAFTLKMVERYVAVPAKALKAADPHHLNLGMRWAFISSDAMFAGTEDIDVYSINCYRFKPRQEDVENILKKCGKPCLIGEFHHGTSDRGCFSNAICATTNSAERGIAYRYYVEQSAAMPSLLGCHYFCFEDESAMGRGDGECYICGFIDVAHRPYEEMWDATTTTHARMYAVKAHRIPPLDRHPEAAAANA